VHGLEFEEAEFFGVGGLAFAEERHDESEADGYFGGCDRDDEENEHLAVEVIIEAGESDEREVGGVEHELEGHVDNEEVFAEDDAQQSQGEQEDTNDDIMFESDAHGMEMAVI
jgi:hypothetical protein